MEEPVFKFSLSLSLVIDLLFKKYVLFAKEIIDLHW